MRGRAQALFYALHCQAQALTLKRFQYVVEGPSVEGGNGVGVIGCDKYNVAAPLRLEGDLQAGQSWHLNVQEHQVGDLFLQQLQRLDSGAGFSDYDKVGPQLAQPLP